MTELRNPVPAFIGADNLIGAVFFFLQAERLPYEWTEGGCQQKV